MAGKLKFIVAIGATLGMAGVFLPLAEATGRWGGGVLSLGLSLWATGGAFTVIFLGAFALCAAIASAAIVRRFGRALAASTLVTAVAPTGIAAIWLSETLARNATGSGLVLMVAGGSVAIVGSTLALIKPERRTASAASTPALA